MILQSTLTQPSKTLSIFLKLIIQLLSGELGEDFPRLVRRHSTVCQKARLLATRWKIS
nr:MAG TPA: hypothetical protein [Myoviridae sp. ctPkE24]